MPNTDFRVQISWLRHEKRRKLIREMGHEGESALLDIWGFCAEASISGIVCDDSPEELAETIRFRGNEQKLYKTLIELRLLDVKKGRLVVHEWEKHQPWAAGAEKRSDAARKANRIRWGLRTGSESDSESDSESNPNRTPPFLSFPKERKIKKEKTAGVSAAEESVYAAYREHHPRGTTRTLAKNKSATAVIRRAMGEGYDAQTCIDAINGCHLDPWSKQHNTALDWALRPKNITRFVEIAANEKLDPMERMYTWETYFAKGKAQTLPDFDQCIFDFATRGEYDSDTPFFTHWEGLHGKQDNNDAGVMGPELLAGGTKPDASKGQTPSVDGVEDISETPHEDWEYLNAIQHEQDGPDYWRGFGES